MSTGTERARWLIEAARQHAGDTPAQRDLELWGHLEIRRRDVAEHIIWENRGALLGSFDALLPALDGPSTAGTAATPAAPAAPQRAVALDPSPQARFQRLLEWRNTHADPVVAGVSEQDLARMASSGATTQAEIEHAAPRLGSNAVVSRYARALSVVLGGGAAPVSPPTPPPAEPAPAPAPPPEADPFAPFAWERAPQFAPFSWGEGAAEAKGHVSAELDGDGVRLAWTPAPAGGVTLYRIVESSSTWPSGAPELGGLIGVTRSSSGTATLRAGGPVTYLAVWANQGENALAAAHAQPHLVGVAQVVWPPTELSVQVTPNRTVAALLTSPEGSRVEVQRFLKGMTVSYDINRELDRELVSATGFRDLTPPMGEDIVYAAFCVAELADGSSMVSSPATVEAHVTPEVQQVEVQVRASSRTPGAYDISWLKPSHGRVLLYATPERLPVGLENEPRTAEIVEGQGLSADHRINYPPTDLGGLMTITDYAVDPDWVRAHFVAVHWVSDEAVWVGPTVSMVTPKAPEHGQIVERVDAQVITFAWPEGVTVVQAYQGPRGQSVDPSDSEPVAQLTRDEYVRMGGMRITRTLPSNGCAIHLYGVVYLDGRPMYSEPSSLDYPGITRLKYQVTPYGPDGSPAAPGMLPASFRVYAEVDDDLHETPLAVVGQINRLPLHPQDGRMLSQPVVSLRAGISTYLAELPAGQTLAFIRLFVNLPPAECGAVAVLDPPVYTLEVTA